MHPVISKTLGGLSASYYFRQFLFGAIFPVFIYAMTNGGKHPLQLNMIALLVVNTLLYPYARFVYEGIVGFLLGNNVFFVNAVLMLVTKAFTMLLCWVFALFIAPIGLAYLYYTHTKAAR
jgi:hypothetical protein